jgi:hypothetical protein
MEKNFTALGPHVLPLSEQVKVVASIVSRLIGKKTGWFKVSPGYTS